MIDLLIILAAGFIGGYIGAQVGSGALITIPALIFIGLEPALAIGTNIIAGLLTNVVATIKYWKSGKLNFHFVLLFSLLSFVGAIIGSNILLDIDKTILNKLVALFFVALIFVLFQKPKAGIITEQNIGRGKLTLAYGLSFLLGIYGGFFSVGVTTFLVFLYVLLLGRDFIAAIANSTFVTSIMLIGATIIFIIKDNIDYSLAIPLSATSIAGSYLGAHTALKFGDKWLKIFITLTVASLIIKLLLGL